MKYLIQNKKEFIITLAVLCVIVYVLYDGFKNGREPQSVVESAIMIVAWYFNMPTSKENCEATGEMRQRKAEKKANYVGEKFYEEEGDE